MSTLRDRQNARDGLARDGLKVLAGGRQPLVAAVDIGASKIGCFIMKPDGANRDTRSINVTGVAHVRSAGVRGGAIINMDEAAHAIAQAVERAESMAGVNVGGVVITTAGGQLASHRTSTTIQLSGRPISDHDLSRALQLAVAQARFLGRRPIHLLPIAWSVDGARGVRDPRNMFGRQLNLDLLVVTMNESAFQTLGHCLELVHLQFDGVVAAPFASALAALEDDEMDLGAVCIDMGGGSTSVAVFGDGQPAPRRQPGGRRQPTSPPTSRGASPPPPPAPSASRPCTAAPSPAPTRTARPSRPRPAATTPAPAPSSRPAPC